MHNIKPELTIFTSYLYTGIEPKRVTVVPFAEVPDKERIAILEKLRKSFKLNKNAKAPHILKMATEPNYCYDNALLICRKSSKLDFEVHYVEGEAISNTRYPFPVIHVWNYLPHLDLHFDLTWETWLNGFKASECKYFPVVQDLPTKLISQGYDLNSSVDVFTQWLNRQEIPDDSPWNQILRNQA
jgi:hypothetical protein